MQKWIGFVFPLFLYAIISSCNMEKRLYRNGWYMENRKEKDHSVAVLNSISLVKTFSETKIKPKDSIEKKQTIAPQIKRTIDSARVLQRMLRDTVVKKLYSNPNGRMTYDEAKGRMTKEGCTPDTMADVTYYLGIASCVLVISGGGFFFAIITLIVAFFAKRSLIRKKSDCIEENLAIINDGKRLALLALVVSIGLLVISFLLFLALLRAFGF